MPTEIVVDVFEKVVGPQRRRTCFYGQLFGGIDKENVGVSCLPSDVANDATERARSSKSAAVKIAGHLKLLSRFRISLQ